MGMYVTVAYVARLGGSRFLGEISMGIVTFTFLIYFSVYRRSVKLFLCFLASASDVSVVTFVLISVYLLC